ncbi:MAG: DUF4333 domain-containing protein [Solirubrobacterales bacterium]|nr:DUF4333 domain-containing protein [Solirubrobacterales bacterium]
MKSPIRKITLVGTLLVPMVALAGCGGAVVDPVKTEIAVRYDVEAATGVKVAAVDCPAGIEVRANNRFACRVRTGNGDRALAELVVLNDRADLRLIRLRKP